MLVVLGSGFRLERKLLIHLSTLLFFMEMRLDVPGDKTLESTVRELAG